jgi:hypothetical protein
MRSNFQELPRFIWLADEWGAAVQLLHVIGNREGEDIFVRQDQHRALYGVLEEADEVARGAARDQVARIRKILDAHQPGAIDVVRAAEGGA